MKKLRLAILDMNNGVANMGLNAIKDIVRTFEAELDWQVFDVRAKHEIPDLSFDIYISSGGPGSPFDGDGIWDKNFFKLIDSVWSWNKTEEQKKHLFLICHSYQMACIHFKIADVVKRKSKSFGVFPTHKTINGETEPVFENLPDTFWIGDFRDWQVLQPNFERMNDLGIQLLCLEKIRPHVPLERAMMAIRFSDEIFGTQFHPEAYPKGMIETFQKEEKKQYIIDTFGAEKYTQMMEDLNNPQKIQLTYDTILPTFIERAIESCRVNVLV